MNQLYRTITCPVCKDPLRTRDSRQKYHLTCSPKAKQQQDSTRPGRKNWDQRLPSVLIGIDERCIYCGEPYQCIDHMIPINHQRHNRKNLEWENAGPLAYACDSCNVTLGDTFFPNITARIARCQENIAKRAKRYRNVPAWTDSEIAKLDWTLQTYVAYHQKEIATLDRRATYNTSSMWKRLQQQIKMLPELDLSSPKYVEYYVEFLNPNHPSTK